MPQDWENASISLPGLKAEYIRNGNCTKLILFTDLDGVKQIDLPIYHSGVEQFLVNGEECSFETIASFDTPKVRFATSAKGRIEIQLYENSTALPCFAGADQTTFAGNIVNFKLSSGTIKEIVMPDSKVELVSQTAQNLRFRAGNNSGKVRGVVLAELEDAKLYLPISLVIEADEAEKAAPAAGVAESIDLTNSFNCEFTKIHEQSFMSPRPTGYSIGMQKNGRYAWEWNQFGHNGYVVDDTALRSCGGTFALPNGGSFKTPASGNNVLCVSIWDNFPTTATVPVSGKGVELELYLCGSTNAMQSFVENGKITVNYADGSKESLSLIHPVNFDDFLVPALQQEFDYFYFSTGNHGIVCRIPLNAEKEFESFTMEAIANEVIISLFGANIKRGN